MRLKHLFLPLVLLPCYALADGRVLHFSNYSLNLQNSCTTDHKLNVQIGNELYCAPLTTDWSDNSLHVLFGGTTYTVCNGECGGGEWVMPEEPGDPIIITDPDCNWSQPNANAYLYSDGRQYFDTKEIVDSTNDVEVTIQVANGKNVHIFGTVGGNCPYNMTLNQQGKIGVFMGSSAVGKMYNLSNGVATAKNTFRTEKASVGNSYVNKHIYVNNTKLSSSTSKRITNCTGTSEHTLLVLNNDYVTGADQTQSGGIKLYNIIIKDISGNVIHNFQPVAQGTNVCGHVAQANCMWDVNTKHLYYPAGTGEMGYGVDQ